MNRFFIYKEYGAKYELMIKDVTAAHCLMPSWDVHQKGLETLASTLEPYRSSQDEGKKALTVGDLLVKVRNSVFFDKQQADFNSPFNGSANTRFFSLSS